MVFPYQYLILTGGPEGNTSNSWGWAEPYPWTISNLHERRESRGTIRKHESLIEYIRGQARTEFFEYRIHLGLVALDAKEGSYLGATPNDLLNSFLHILQIW